MRKILYVCIVITIMLLGTGCNYDEEEVYLDATDDLTKEDMTDDKDEERIFYESDAHGNFGISAENELPIEPSEAKEVASCVVYVCGAVKCAGVYELTAGNRIVNAIEAAGGFSEAADRDFLNQALLLNDGEKIYVPTIEETTEAGLGMGNDNLLQENSGSSVGNVDGASGLVNINHADKTELMTLPGVGDAKASAIVEYRNAKGSFGNIEDVMLVHGIKQGLFDKIKDKICI